MWRSISVKVKRVRPVTYGLGIMLAAILVSIASAALTGRTTSPAVDETPRPASTPQLLQAATGNTCGLAALCEPFYGLQFVYQDDLAAAKALGIEVILTDVRHNDTPATWLAFLNAAQAHGLRVIPWLWPEGWSWDGTTWHIDAQARLFLQTVAGHPAVFAVYALHEPYWNGCYGCGYSTATQQALYTAIKAIADVPLYSELSSISGWTARGAATAFADGVCDYCANWYYPFKTGGIYERSKVIEQLTADLNVAAERAPNSKVIWIMPAFEYAPDDLRLPSTAEMQDLAAIVYARPVAGAWWYPWKFGDLYSDYLANHPQLYAAVKSIYESYVLGVKSAVCRPIGPCWQIYLPLIHQSKP